MRRGRWAYLALQSGHYPDIPGHLTTEAMSNDKTNGSGPAFPAMGEHNSPSGNRYVFNEGLSLRQYAAIKLRVPDSGEEWLDEMIKKSLRDEFAGKAMQGLISATDDDGTWTSPTDVSLGKISYRVADALLKAREQ